MELAQSCATQRRSARATELHLFSRNPRQRDFPQSWGLGSNLVSLVPCLGDAIGVVETKIHFGLILRILNLVCTKLYIYAYVTEKSAMLHLLKGSVQRLLEHLENLEKEK